jgi:pyrimidine deaminase RibD-like protein
MEEECLTQPNSIMNVSLWNWRSEWQKKACEDDGRSHPMVGAVIARDGHVLQTGFRGEAHNAHADEAAIAKLTPAQAVGTTVYTTLEPCTTRGNVGKGRLAILHALKRKDYKTAFAGMREHRGYMNTIGKITGELSPASGTAGQCSAIHLRGRRTAQLRTVQCYSRVEERHASSKRNDARAVNARRRRMTLSKKPVCFPDPKVFNLTETEILNWLDKKQSA